MLKMKVHTAVGNMAINSDGLVFFLPKPIRKTQYKLLEKLKFCLPRNVNHLVCVSSDKVEELFQKDICSLCANPLFQEQHSNV